MKNILAATSLLCLSILFRTAPFVDSQRCDCCDGLALTGINSVVLLEPTFALYDFDDIIYSVDVESTRWEVSLLPVSEDYSVGGTSNLTASGVQYARDGFTVPFMGGRPEVQVVLGHDSIRVRYSGTPTNVQPASDSITITYSDLTTITVTFNPSLFQSLDVQRLFCTVVLSNNKQITVTFDEPGFTNSPQGILVGPLVGGLG